MKYDTLLWDSIQEGQEITPLSIRITFARLLAMVAGTRTWPAIHSNRDYARAAGNRDVIVDAGSMQGLVTRCMTDWAGPEAFIRRLHLEMRAPNCPGDLLTITGKVTRRYEEDGSYLVDLDIVGHNQLGMTTIAQGTIDIPSRAGAGPLAKMPSTPPGQAQEPPPDVPEPLRKFLGQKIPSPDRGEKVPEVSVLMIQNALEPLEDGNPVYWDPQFAARSRFGGFIVPPHLQGILNRSPEWPVVEQPPSPVERVRALLPDYPFQIAFGGDRLQFRPVYLGDRLRSVGSLTAVSPRKRTRLGSGFFITFESSTYNQRGEEVTRNLSTLFRYQKEEGPRQSRPWDSVTQGEALPEGKLPIQIPVHDELFANYIRSFVTSWAGPTAEIRKLEVNILEKGGYSLNGYGEILTLSGRVTKKYRQHGSGLVDLGIQTTNYGTPTSVTEATLALP